MKKVLVLGALCALVTGASAQVKAYKADQMTNPNSVAYALPRTVVKVRVVAEKESVRVGPYARFAQKYLGVIAPLADKDIYTISMVGKEVRYTIHMTSSGTLIDFKLSD